MRYEREPEAKTIVTRISEEVLFEENIVDNQFTGPRGRYSAAHWPSDVLVHRHPNRLLFKLAADWDLPESVKGGYNSLSRLHGVVASRLSARALDDYEFQESEADSSTLFPTETPKKLVKDAGHTNEYTRYRLNVRERWERHRVTAEVWSELGELPGSIMVTKDGGREFYSVSAAFDLPDSLNGLHISLEQVLTELRRQIKNGFFSNKS